VGENVFDPAANLIGAFERCGVWELHVAEQDSLILFRDEPTWQNGGHADGARGDKRDDEQTQKGPAGDRLRDAQIAVGGAAEEAVERREEAGGKTTPFARRPQYERMLATKVR